MLRCDNIDLAAYHDHALSENDLRQIDIHLQYCPACMTRYAQEVRLVSGFAEIPHYDPPKHFIPHVMYRVRQEIYSQIEPAEERRFSLLTAGYGLALLTLVVFLGGIQKTFFETTLGWVQLPIKSIIAVMGAMNNVTESGSHWLTSFGKMLLPTLLIATLVAGFMLVKLLTQYERVTLQEARFRARRGENERTS
jgi:predicted anti-sigma-YlaC factor YlaD